MKDLNRILIQFNRAINCANSKYPQDKALSVILFDNLIELQLYKRAENLFMWDSATWYNGGRAINKTERQNIIGEKGKYDKLLKFSKDNSMLTNEEQEIISFTHEIRNAVYHRNEDDETKIEIALLLYFSFLRRKLKDWGSPNGFIVITEGTAYEQIDFGQGLESDSRYFNDALDYLFSVWQYSENLDEKVIKLFSLQLREIRDALLYVKTNSKELNYYAALGHYWFLNDQFSKYESQNRKPKNLDSILLLSLYLRKFRDELEDIDDLESRQKRGKILLRKLRQEYKGKYPYWTDLYQIEKRIKNLKGKSEHTIIKNIIDIQKKLHNLYQDIGEAASNFDGYTQDLRDRIRGK